MHSVPNSWGLGKTFPVVDRLETENRLVVSTKSVDLGLNSYQYGAYLLYILNKNAGQLITFEEKYFDSFGEMPSRYGHQLSLGDFDSKAIEIVVPDMVINQRTLDILKDFCSALMIEGIDVWFVIAV